MVDKKEKLLVLGILLHHVVPVVIWTDVLEKGWGAHLDTHQVVGVWEGTISTG